MNGSLKTLLILFLCLWVGELRPIVSYGEEPKESVILVMNRGNETKEFAWQPGLTLADVLLRRTEFEFRLIVQIWRKGERLRLREKDWNIADQIILRPADVVVLGMMDESRAKQIEEIPLIAAAIGKAVSPASKNED
jgi:hypothetical protein